MTDEAKKSIRRRMKRLEVFPAGKAETEVRPAGLSEEEALLKSDRILLSAAIEFPSDEPNGNTKMPSLTQADVVDAADAVLAAGPQTREDRKNRIADRLRPTGNLSGWIWWLREALRLSWFRKTEPSVRVARSEGAPTATPKQAKSGPPI